jgi:tetratricopeptide (TPR) repeat protein
VFTGEPMRGVKFSAAVANYLHCVLPLTILRKQEGKLFEKHISLQMEADSEMAEGAGAVTALDVPAIVNDPTNETLWPKIEETADFRPIEVETFFEDMNDFKVIEDMVKYYDVATVIYPYGSFESVKNFVPLMKRGAIYIISDKGYADFHYMAGENECLPSLHGNSFAHSVNFPLIDEYAKSLGLKTCRTYDPSYSLQTLVMENPAASENESLRKRFRELFVRENPNQDSSDFMTAAMDYEKNKEPDKAASFLRKALVKRPFDAKVFYRLGNSCYESCAYERALDYYTQGAEYDYFNLYDFNFCIGQAKFCLGSYEEAIPYYMKSIGQNKDNPKYSYVNIGLCNNRTGKYWEAEIAFKKALEIDPDYARAKVCLETNGRRERI